MPNIFIDLPIDPKGFARLNELDGVSVTLADPIAEDEIARPTSSICTAEIAFCSALPSNSLDMAHLALVQIASSGFSQLTPHHLPARGVRACNARGVFDTAIAEWNIAMMVCLARNLRQMISNQEMRVWDRSAQFQKEIRGATVGFWGYGGIARQTARLSKSLGLTVHALTRSGAIGRRDAYVVPGSGDVEGTFPDRIFSMDQRMEFLRELDFLILCTPHTVETDGMIGVDELRALPRGAFLLNPARGGLVQEAALIRALTEKWIAGAALDTHYHYPLPAEHPLWGFNNVILTPHISGSSNSPFFLTRVWDLFTVNVSRYLSKQPLLNELSSQELAP